jgi:copper chaperone CopZ
VRVAVQKLDGVESADVSLQFKTADIRLRPGNRVTLQALRTAIKDSGFTAKEATVTVIGRIIERGGKPALEATGLSAVLLIAADPARPAAYDQASKRLAAKQTGVVEVAGVINPPATLEQPEQILIHAIAAVEKGS